MPYIDRFSREEQRVCDALYDTPTAGSIGRSDERVSWRWENHTFVDDDGYVYTTLGEFDFDEWELPPGWYRTIELEPDTRARCVTAVDTTPDGTRIERVIYRDEGGPRLGVAEDSTPETTEQYELDVSETAFSALGSPPFEG